MDWCKEHGIEIRDIQPGKPNSMLRYKTPAEEAEELCNP